VSYGYNATSMLQGEGASQGGASTPALSKSYGFDAMGNRTGYSDAVAKTQVTSTYNTLNQLTSTNSFNTSTGQAVATGSSALGYDGDGNMALISSKDAAGTVTSQTSYSYDDASRLIGITTPGSSKWQFVYDGKSRLRISRSWVWQNGAWVQNSEKRRVYLGMSVVQERDGNNLVTASYTRTGNIGGLLARSTSTGNVFYGYDGSGNVTTLTDGTGATVGFYTYDAWGNILNSLSPKAQENPYRYSGKEQLAGYYSYGFRFYNAGLGRWINRDPIREAGGTNVYGFVGSDPVNSVDLYGLLIDNGYVSFDPARQPNPYPPQTPEDERGDFAGDLEKGGAAAIDGIPSVFNLHPMANHGYYNQCESWVPWSQGFGAIGGAAGALAGGLALAGGGAITIGAGLGSSTGIGVTTGAASTGVKESIEVGFGLHSPGEGFHNVVGGAITGGILGGAVKGPLASKFPDLHKAIAGGAGGVASGGVSGIQDIVKKRFPCGCGG